MNEDNNTKAALDFAANVTAPEVFTFEHRDGRPEQVLITRGDHGRVDIALARDLISKHASAPERRKGTIVAHDLASFIAAVNRDKRPDSVIFADAGRRTVTALLDFHGPADTSPRFGEDRVEYGFKLSAQLEAWLQAARSPMDQKTFSALIDNRLGDIGEGRLAEGGIAAEFARRRGIQFATIMDLVVFTRTIAAKSTTESEEQIDENTGDVSIQFKKRSDVKTPDGAAVPVPKAFVLAIPILNGLGATEFSVAVRLRYDITDSKIAWRIELHALDKYLEAAIKECLDVIRRDDDDEVTEHGEPQQVGCGLPVYLGTPA